MTLESPNISETVSKKPKRGRPPVYEHARSRNELNRLYAGMAWSAVLGGSFGHNSGEMICPDEFQPLEKQTVVLTELGRICMKWGPVVAQDAARDVMVHGLKGKKAARRLRLIRLGGKRYATAYGLYLALAKAIDGYYLTHKDLPVDDELDAVGALLELVENIRQSRRG